MTVEFIESFDHLTLAQIARKWTTLVGAPTITGSGRTGSALTANSTTRYLTKTFNNSRSTWIVGFAINVSVMGPNKFIVFCLTDAGDVQCGIIVNTDLTLTAYRSTDGVKSYVTISNLLTSTKALSLGAWNYVEVKFVIGDAPNGSVEIRIDDVAKSLGGLDTKYSANATANGMCLGYISGATTYATIALDDLYVIDCNAAPNNNFLGDRRVYCLLPSGAGNAAQWTKGGSVPAATNWQSVDEVTPDDDVTEVHSATTNQIDTHPFTNLAAGTTVVTAIQTNIIAKKDDAGVRQIAPVVRPLVTDRVGATVSLTTSYMDYMQVYDVNPETTVTWTKDEVDASEFGYKEIT